MVTARKSCVERPTIERVNELLEYNPDTGNFFWKVPRKINQVKAGSVAGSLHVGGYIEIGFDGHRIMAHVLAYFIMTGSWPELTVDHKNRKRLDNRWENLRPATHSEQVCNTSLNSKNTSGHRGVYLDKRRGTWNAEVRFEKFRHRKSGFKTAEEANQWVTDARMRYHGEFFSITN